MESLSRILDKALSALSLLPEAFSALREVPHGTRVNAVAFSPDGKLLASACWDGKLRVFDAGELAPHAEATPGAMATPKAAPSAAPPHDVTSHSYLSMYG